MLGDSLNATTSQITFVPVTPSIDFLLPRRPQSLFERVSALAVMLAVGVACLQMSGAVVRAQDFIPSVASSAPLGLRSLTPSGIGSAFAPAQGLKGGFYYGLGIKSIYDSNFFLAEQNTESELTTNITPWINYQSDPEGGAPYSITASYQPTIRSYLNNSDLDGVDHSGGASLKLEGGKTMISTYLNYNTVSGVDRFSGTYTNSTLLSGGIRGTYQIAPRTQLFASWTYDKSDYGSSSLVGSEIFTTEVGGYWSATERFSIGPAIRYNVSQSRNTGTRDAWALSMQARYLAGERIQFFGSLGLEYAQNSGPGTTSTVGLTGSLTSNFAINDKLTWVNSLRYETLPSPNNANYNVDNLQVTTALNRQLLRATLGLGLELNMSDYVAVGTVDTQLKTDDTMKAFLAYRRKFFLDRVDFDSVLRYSVNRGNMDWSQLELSAGFVLHF